MEDIAMRADQAIQAICMPAKTPDTSVTPQMTSRIFATTKSSTKPPTSSGIPGPSPAVMFMQSRPEGPQQQTVNARRSQERQVSTQLQAKATTSSAGQDALKAISTLTTALNEEKQPPVVTPPHARKKAKPTKAKTTVTKAKPTKTKNTKRKTGNKPTTTVPIVTQVDAGRQQSASLPTCLFGCGHGGLLDLLQMSRTDIKYSVKAGNYLHGKKCQDCKQQIADLFAISNNKAQFYYCQLDYNVAELDNDTAVASPKPCNCILCLTCYFKRDQKKAAAQGTTVRSSRRR
jgi:hypothetical protein